MIHVKTGSWKSGIEVCVCGSTKNVYYISDNDKSFFCRKCAWNGKDSQGRKKYYSVDADKREYEIHYKKDIDGVNISFSAFKEMKKVFTF